LVRFDLGHFRGLVAVGLIDMDGEILHRLIDGVGRGGVFPGQGNRVLDPLPLTAALLPIGLSVVFHLSEHLKDCGAQLTVLADIFAYWGMEIKARGQHLPRPVAFQKWNSNLPNT
jgi:hypothetical protein